MSTIKKVQTILNKAADHLDEVGLAKGIFVLNNEASYKNVETAPKCAMGAIRYINSKEKTPLSTRTIEDVFAKYLRDTGRYKTLFQSNFIIADYNDKATIKKHHVVTALRKCAESLDNS